MLRQRLVPDLGDKRRIEAIERRVLYGFQIVENLLVVGARPFRQLVLKTRAGAILLDEHAERARLRLLHLMKLVEAMDFHIEFEGVGLEGLAIDLLTRFATIAAPTEGRLRVLKNLPAGVLVLSALALPIHRAPPECHHRYPPRRPCAGR